MGMQFFGGTVMRMVMFGVTALILLHWAACTFYFTAVSGNTCPVSITDTHCDGIFTTR
jgi:hypothetical protein